MYRRDPGTLVSPHRHPHAGLLSIPHLMPAETGSQGTGFPAGASFPPASSVTVSFELRSVEHYYPCSWDLFIKTSSPNPASSLRHPTCSYRHMNIHIPTRPSSLPSCPSLGPSGFCGSHSSHSAMLIRQPVSGDPRQLFCTS